MDTENIVKILSELVEIKSISSDKNHGSDVLKSAEYVKDLFSSELHSSRGARAMLFTESPENNRKKTKEKRKYYERT